MGYSLAAMTIPVVAARAAECTHSWPDFDSARAAFYGDCSLADARWAYDRLRRQNSVGLWGSPYPLSEWPEVQVHVVAGAEDRALSLDWVRHAARRLDTDPVIMPGGHSPFLARPDLLADTLRAVLDVTTE